MDPMSGTARRLVTARPRLAIRLKKWRGIATRYEKTATIYLAGPHIAGILLRSAG